MRAQCCICADLFESAQTVNIAAAPCGHVFHEACLMRWMETSSTCPSCRTHVKKTQIIKRLFFDISEEDDREEDVSHFVNQVSELKAQLREKTSSLREAAESRDKTAALLAVSEASREELTTKLTREKSLRDLVKSDFVRVQKENEWHVKEILELQKKAEKLQELQRVEVILKGSSSDAEEMVRQYSDGGDTSIRQLSSLVTVMKREYNQTVADKRAAKEELSKLKQQVRTCHAAATRAKRETQDLRAELETTYESLSLKEKENDENRRKIVHLRRALRHNQTEGSQSFHEALSEDSPNVAYTPVQQRKPNPTATVARPDKTTPTTTRTVRGSAAVPAAEEMCTSPDLFEESPAKKENGYSRAREENLDRISSTALPYSDRPQDAKRPRLPAPKTSADAAIKSNDEKLAVQPEEDDGPQIPALMMNILRKKLTGVSNSYPQNSSRQQQKPASVITRGYDGFGGSTTFVHPLGPPRGSLLKPSLQQKKKRGLGVKKNGNIQRQPVPRCQRQIQDCMGASGATSVSPPSAQSLPSSSSSSSSSVLLSSLSSTPPSSQTLKPSSSSKICLKKLSSSSSLKSSSFPFKKVSSSSSSSLGMFASKGRSVSAKTTEAQMDVIDLT